MYDELEIFEFLESDAAATRQINEAKIKRKRLHDISDPFDMEEINFIKRYRLSQQLVLSLCEELRPHVAGPTKATDLPLERKVLIALSFYATGSYQRPVGDISAHSVVQPTVSVTSKQNKFSNLVRLLNLPQIQAKYIKFPRTIEERTNNKIRFFNKFGMPGVLGCIDCTHVAIVRPVENEERYYCRKQYHSLNVQLISNADMDIISVDASFGGATHDSFIWANHPIKGHMEEISINEAIWLLGGFGYPLRKFLMTPITGATPDSPESHYTDVHVRTRNVIERTIGLLKARFRCLLVHRVLHYAPRVASSIVNACLILHNICNRANVPVQDLTDEEAVLEASRQDQQINTGTHTIDRQESSSNTRNNRELREGLALRSTLVSRLWSTRGSTN